MANYDVAPGFWIVELLQRIPGHSYSAGDKVTFGASYAGTLVNSGFARTIAKGELKASKAPKPKTASKPKAEKRTAEKGSRSWLNKDAKPDSTEDTPQE